MDPETNLSFGVDIQIFPESGIWHKPPGAVRTRIVLQGSNGGDASNGDSGIKGQVTTCSLTTEALPDHMDVEIGKGGRPGGADGYALIVTELRVQEGAT